MNTPHISWTDKGTGLVEASDLGFPPGVFPKEHDFPCQDGEVRTFERTGIKRKEGEIEEVTYRNAVGTAVVVFND